MIIANILWYMNIQLYKNKKGLNENYLESYLEASTLWMLSTFMITEVLSVFHAISRISLIVVWCSLDILLCLLLLRSLLWKRKNKAVWKQDVMACFPIKNLDKYKWNLILFIIAIIVLFLALKTVPYNWDSMTYRLSRVAYWAQNGSVEHYANNSLRLIANPPLGEFIQLQLYVLMGKSDMFFNLVQYFSYITCAIVVYAIAKKIKCHKVFCFLATLLFMSMPIAFAEAINTQVDLIATVWLLVFLYLMLGFTGEEKITWSGSNIFKVCIMGFSVAWGYLTKPSVCFAMVIFAIWLLVICIIRKDKLSVLIRLACCAGVSLVLPLSWEILRNIQTFHAISSPIAGARQLIGTLHPGYVFLNGLKNIMSNLPMPNLSVLSNFYPSLLYKIAFFLRIDLNAEVISEDGAIFKMHSTPDYGHDTAINPIIVWLFIICLVWALANIRKLNWKQLNKSYSFVAGIAFLICCIMIRWEFYVTRYMLSYFTLLCPMIALQLQKLTEGKQKIELRYVIVGITSCLCLLDVVNMTAYHRNIYARDGFNERPLGYFTVRSNEYEPCLEICGYIIEEGYKDIGIYLGGNDYEYPYWALLSEHVDQVQHVNVQNESSIYLDEEYKPECVIWLGNPPKEAFSWNGETYPNIMEVAEKRYLLMTE